MKENPSLITWYVTVPAEIITIYYKKYFHVLVICEGESFTPDIFNRPPSIESFTNYLDLHIEVISEGFSFTDYLSATGWPLLTY